MTRRGFGAVEQLPSGKWRAKYRHAGRRFAAPVTFVTRKHADAWLAGEHVKISAGTWTPPAAAAVDVAHGTTVADWIDMVIADRDIADRTREGYEMVNRLHLRPAFGDIAVANLTTADVAVWHKGALRDRPTMRSHAYQLLRSAMDAAVKAGMRTDNPCAVKSAGKAVKRVGKTEVATVEDIALLAKAMPDRLRLMVLLSGWAGFRYGEVTEFRRGDVDRARGVIRVRRAVVRLKRTEDTPAGVQRFKVKAPKSDEGSRDVIVPSFLWPFIEDHLRDHVAPGADALLFPAANDPTHHLAPSTLYKSYYPARDLIGRPDLRFHDLRHTSGTMFTQAGGTLAEVMALLGHSTPVAALRYQHATNDRMAMLAAKMSGMATGI